MTIFILDSCDVPSIVSLDIPLKTENLPKNEEKNN